MFRKNPLIILVVLALAVTLAPLAQADCGKCTTKAQCPTADKCPTADTCKTAAKDHCATTTAQNAEVKGAAYHAQTHCPVMKGEVDGKAYTDYAGQRIYFCCPGCEKDFLANAEKHMAQFETDGVEVESIQTTCPVSGEEIDRAEAPSTHFRGRKVYTCCLSCLQKFTADPEKYIQNVK